jgi:putative membrane protein
VCAERERRAGDAGNPQAQAGERECSARNRKRFDFVETGGVEFHTFKNGGNSMKRLLTAVCCITLLSIPALAQKRAHDAKAKGAMTDQQFVDFAAQTDMVEANLGQFAQTASDNQQVKDYGQTLATDHTQDFGNLKTAAQQANLTVPDAIDAAHNKSLIDPFQKLKGAAFDHKYAQEMVAGHTKALEVYKKEAADAENPAIKSYAEAAIPVLEKHLAGAKDLEKAKAAKGKM